MPATLDTHLGVSTRIISNDISVEYIILAEKIPDGSININPVDYFLNEAFVSNFFEARVLSKLKLSEFRILKCEINRLKSRRRKPAIEFKLWLYNKNNSDNHKQQQQTYVNLVGKWRNDELLKETFDLLQELWSKGFQSGDDDHLKISKPIAYFPDYNLMLASKASGIELGKMLMGGDASVLENYIMQAASWLAKLHSIDIRSGRAFSLETEEAKLRHWSEHLCFLYPDFAEKICNLFSLIFDKERSLDSKCFVLIHGDYNPNNTFVDGNDITVIDFEQSCIFDPAFDLGYFIAKLISAKRKYNLPLDVDDLEKRFLDKYTAKISIEPLKRVGLYKARSFLQHLHFRYWTGRSHHKPDQLDCQYWINKTEECLQLQ
jgi:Phosphotransferase enzyme family